MLQFLYDAIGRLVDASYPNGFATTMFPPPSDWHPSMLEDQSGKVALITGANQGIGYEIVKLLLEHHATVFLGSRDPEKAIQKLREETGKEARLLVIDLADLASVKQAAKDIEGQTKRLDYLFLNAGIHSPPLEELTAQGYDLQQGIVMGHAYFTQLLLPLLKSTYQDTRRKPRVISISSNGNTLHPGDPFDEALTRPGEARTKMGRLNLYHFSKVENILFANWLQRTHGDFLISNSLHPGGIRTGLMRNFPRIAIPILSWIFLVDAPLGAWTPVYVACTPAGDKGGKYFIAYCRERSEAADPKAWDAKWQDAFMTWVDKCVAEFEAS